MSVSTTSRQSHIELSESILIYISQSPRLDSTLGIIQNYIKINTAKTESEGSLKWRRSNIVLPDFPCLNTFSTILF